MEKLFNLTRPLPTTLASIVHQAKIHQHLLRHLKTLLPVTVQETLTSCIIQGNQLTLTAANSATLNRLRLHQHQLLAAARSTHPQLIEIIFLLTNPQTSGQMTVEKNCKQNISEHTYQAFYQLAEEIDDAELSTSLRNLASCLSKHTTPDIT